MNPHATASGLRLTPSNSPFFRSNSPRSPTKSSNNPNRNDEPGLRLAKVIGTTACSSNGFACNPATRQFAYTAGAAAVVVTVNLQDLSVSQRFFRARPAVQGVALREWLLAPGTPGEVSSSGRGNGGGRVGMGMGRDGGVSGSPWAGNTPGREWIDSPTGGRGSFVGGGTGGGGGGGGGAGGGAKDRVKAATSVALSPNGKWIAMGETGYRPRVLLFSNADASSELPTFALAEHSFGVRALAFSPDSRFLASLGTVNDGFLYIWAIDDRTGLASLHSSNKCTAMINAVTWIGRSLVTAGLRFVKVWRPDEELMSTSASSSSTAALSPLRPPDSSSMKTPVYQKQKVLAGKNCLLGDLIDANFTTATPLGGGSGERAIVCAETGEICLLDESSSSQSLRALEKVDFPISAATIDRKGSALRVAGPAGCEKVFELETLLKGNLSSPSKRRQTSIASRSLSDANSMTMATALAVIGDVVVELDSRRGIRLSRDGNADGSDENDDDNGTNGHDDNGVVPSSHQLPAHNDTVLGVKPFTSPSIPTAAFLTFSTNGSLRIWDDSGRSCTSLDIPVETSTEMYDLPNELKSASPIDRGARIAAGDRYGSLSILDVATNKIVTRVRAHSADVVDLIAFEKGGAQFVVTGSRDRMIQLFLWRQREERLELLQTMDEHAGAVNGLLTAARGEMLLSCSADRTIVVREAMVRRRSTSFSATTTAAGAGVGNTATRNSRNTPDSDDDPASIAFLILRTISLKSSPASICLEASEMEILVSTMDRSIGKYNLKTGQAGFSFKCSDSEGGESTAIGKVLYTPSLNGNPTIIGVSSGDKSVRLYSEFGALMARDWGHTEGIMDVMLLYPPSSPATNAIAAAAPPKLVTVAADSTIFIWNTASPATTTNLLNTNDNSDPNSVRDSIESPVLPPSKTLTPMAPPLRKVLSYSELSRHHHRSAIAREKSLDDSSSPSPSSQQTPTAATAGAGAGAGANAGGGAPPSPPRLVRKKTSRISLAQPPKLEPAFRSATFPDNNGTGSGGSMGRRSGLLRRRSPSPPSPPNNNGNSNDGGSSSTGNRRTSRRPSLAPSLRSKSSEGLLSSQFYSSSAGGGGGGGGLGGNVPPLPPGAAGTVANANASSFGSLTASTEAVCRTLRAYRKKLSNAAATSTSSSSNSKGSDNNTTTGNANSSSASGGSGSQFALDSISPDTLRELEKELKLTARVVGEKFLLATGGKPQLLDENAMTKLLDRASERIVGLLDQRIKERLDGGEVGRMAADDDDDGEGEGDVDGEEGNNGGEEAGNGKGDGRAVGGGGGTVASSAGAAALLATTKSEELIGRDEKVRVLAGALAEVKLGR